MITRQDGFSLVEIAVVLVILGFLLGSVLAGSELVTSARVKTLMKQQDDVRIAYFAFFDRYRSLAGDYSSAARVLSEISTTACNGGNGNGNSRIEAAGHENILVWEHLSKAGFLNVRYTCADTASPTTSPMNPYARPLEIVYDANYGDAAPVNRHNLKTGGQIPSSLLAEMDLKIDDGKPLLGSFRAVPPATDCYDTTAGAWLTTTPGLDCAGATLF
jgi:prepilin-type N-terminal cleavage/methylation domain-containing protein